MAYMNLQLSLSMKSKTTSAQIPAVNTNRKTMAPVNDGRRSGGTKKEISRIKHVTVKFSELQLQCESTSKRISPSSIKKSTTSKSSSHQTAVVLVPKSLPVRMKRLYDRKHSDKYSENEKKIRQKRKREYENKVGWQQRIGAHRHMHQYIREKQFLNFMKGLPLDLGCEDSD